MTDSLKSLLKMPIHNFRYESCKWGGDSYEYNKQQGITLKTF